MSERRVQVDLRDRAYAVRVGRGALGAGALSLRSLAGPKARRVFVVADTGVPVTAREKLCADLEGQGFAVTCEPVTPGEAIKTLDTVRELLVACARSGHTRVDPVVALGGGVVGDIAGFVAASYQRGVPVMQCPTTLLSMVDASVGGKTGVNLAVAGDSGDAGLYKNMVGAFWQPVEVCADIDVLDSLEPRHRRAGLAECVKHAMICASVPGGHGELLGWTQSNLGGIVGYDPDLLCELVARNVALKASVVMGDERESPEAPRGGRMLLNFGHTFGHAIETLPGISPDPDDPSLAPLHHGEAVGLGMVAACAAGAAMGLCDESVKNVLVGMLGQIGLPTRVSGLPGGAEIAARMGRDKKAAGGALRVILPSARGECVIVSDPDPAALIAGIDAIRA